MKISEKIYSQLIFEAFKETDSRKQQQLISGISRLVLKNNDSTKLKKIVEFFEELVLQENGEIKVEFFLAKLPTVDEQQKLIADYAKLKKINPLKIRASFNENRELIGGIQIKTNGEILDGTILNKLIRLKKTLIS